MAIIVQGWTECSICCEILWPGEEIVATTAFINEPQDPLWRFSDSAMHRRCYDDWEHRDEFTQRYRITLGKLYPEHLTWPDGEKRPPQSGPFRTARSHRLEVRGVPWMRQHGVDPLVAEGLAPLVDRNGVLVARAGDSRAIQSGTLVLGVHGTLAAHLNLSIEQFLGEFATTVTIAPLESLTALVDSGARGISITRLMAPPAQIESNSDTAYFELARDAASAPLWTRLLSSMNLALYMRRAFPKVLDVLRPRQPMPLVLWSYLPRSYVRPSARIAFQERRHGTHVGMHQCFWNWARKHDARLILSVQAKQMSQRTRQEIASRLTIAPVEQIAYLVGATLPGIRYMPLSVVPSQIPFDEEAAYFELDRAGHLFDALSDSPAMAIHAGGGLPQVRLELWALRELGTQ